jgi:hypothetical protein
MLAVIFANGLFQVIGVTSIFPFFALAAEPDRIRHSRFGSWLLAPPSPQTLPLECRPMRWTTPRFVKQPNALQGTMTVIVVAHRLSTIEGCDSIRRLESRKTNEANGRIEATISNPSLYS